MERSSNALGLLHLPRILVVDDDATFRMLTRKSLQRAGYEVIEADSGENGLTLYEEKKPDLVLLDLMLPGIRGTEVCASLRARWGDATAPIMMVTSSERRESIEECFVAGATDFFTKPINWLTLTHRVRFNLDLRAAMGKLAESERSLARAQRIAHLGSWIWHLESGQVTWSAEAQRILGVDPESRQDPVDTLEHRVHPDDVASTLALMRAGIQSGKGFVCEHRILGIDGEIQHMRQRAEILPDDSGEPRTVHGTIQDITEHVRAHDQIRYLANFDDLTGLSNRSLLRRNLGNVMAAARPANSQVGLLFIDLDRFRLVNDTLGHTAGDKLLRAVAERIKKTTRASDSLAVSDLVISQEPLARTGGDEFMLMLPFIRTPTDAALVAQRILETLLAPFTIENHQVAATGSIGIAIYPQDGDQAETLIRSADTAMYRAKDSGGNTYRFFDDSMNEASVRQLNLESRLREALSEGQLRLHYQPKICLETARVVGMEALLRWNSPELGEVSPEDFIPAAEAAGLIVPIGDWVLLEACSQNKAWQDAGCSRVPVAVNVSVHQFGQQDLEQTVSRVLQQSGLDSRYLELEITESAMMSDAKSTISMLRALKDMGVRIALDDFGTGFSSLSYLKSFPFDTLKIDRSFVKDLPEDTEAAGIVAAIVAMAHVLSLHVVAEGVETPLQRAFLRDCGCDEMQGFLVSRAVPSQEFERFLITSDRETTH